MNKGGYPTVAYADDVAILISGQFPSVMRELMQTALDQIVNWAGENGLRINPSKTELVLFTGRRVVPQFPLPHIGNTQLNLSPQVKYLGLTLDRKLNWRTTVEERIKKATIAFFTCKRLFGRNWGLRPQMVYWLYISIVRPILTYGALVWWTATRRATIRKELAGVQRMACIGISGAMRTTPTAGLEMILGLQPLDLFIKKCACMTAVRIRNNGQLSASPSNTSHANILSEFEGGSGRWRDLDVMFPKVGFDRGYSVKVPSREDWERGGVTGPEGGLVIFTDGSKTVSGTGAGFFSEEPVLDRSYRLEGHVTVFQAEVFAILKASESAKEIPAESITMCSDSRAALLALASRRTSSRLVNRCGEALTELAGRAEVTLVWVPGHRGIHGNEMADELAGAGAANIQRVAEAGIGRSLAAVRAELEDNLWRETDLRWTGRSDCNKSRTTWPHPNRGRSKRLLSWSRNSVRAAVGAYTGHCLLRGHAKRMGTVADDICRGCGEESETREK